jgi:hypothetical protein
LQELPTSESQSYAQIHSVKNKFILEERKRERILGGHKKIKKL